MQIVRELKAPDSLGRHCIVTFPGVTVFPKVKEYSQIFPLS